MNKAHVLRNSLNVIEKLTEGVFATAIDMTLWFVVYVGEMSIPQSTSGQIWRAHRAADEVLSKINYNTIKHGIAEARRRGFLKSSKLRRKSWPEITKSGKKRLSSTLPFYDDKRVWDKRMYVVTYDIPEKMRRKRDLLREYMQSIGCAKLQDSVYMTPYDPRDTLEEYIKESKLSGTIIVSDVGTNGSIGDVDLHELVARVYNLKSLNDRYKGWIAKVHTRGGVDNQAVIGYFAILRDDPQLPFPLLKSWWKGDEAYALVKVLLNKLLI